MTAPRMTSTERTRAAIEGDYTFADLQLALGCGIRDKWDESALRYEKVVTRSVPAGGMPAMQWRRVKPSAAA